MGHVLCAGTENERGKNLGERIDGQPQPEHLCGAAQSGSNFVQLKVREVQVAEATLMEELSVPACACERLVPHIQAIAAHLEQQSTAQAEAAALFDQAGQYLRDRARYEQAAPLYQRALAIREQELGPDHPDTAGSLNNLALLYWDQGKNAEAEPLVQRALAIDEHELGANHPSTATSLNNLALLYLEQGKYPEAEPLYQRALAIREQALGPDHPDTATTLENYAFLLRRMQRSHEAVPLEQRARTIRAKRQHS